MDVTLSWLEGNWIELGGAIISLIYLWFSYHQKILLWPFGLLSAIFYIWIYYDSGFYADMSLQFYYVVISVYGWLHWAKGQTGDDKAALPVIRVKRRETLILVLVFLALWLIIWRVLDQLTDSQVPVMDALTTSGSIIATWMLARKILEHWLLWIAIDLISMGLYIYKGLYATSILFLVYTIVAFAGYVSWKKSLRGGQA